MENKLLSKSSSNRLHALRWGAAFVVLLGHIEMVVKWRTGTSVWPWAYQMAHLAVIAFFVLSGFIISHVAFRATELSKYMQERVTRIYSVLAPAVLLTATLDMTGELINPSFYEAYAAQSNYMFRLFINLFGLQGWQGHRVQFGTNSPLWSIGYEMFFYVAFGFIFYKVVRANQTRNQRIFWLFATLILMGSVGFEMVAYLFIWALGALAYRVRNHYRLPRYGFLIAMAICYISFVTIPPGYWQDLVFSLGLFLFFLSRDGGGHGIRFNEFMANFSYSLYATHLPVMFIIFATFWQANFDPVVFSLSVIAVCMVFAYFFSVLFEIRRYVLRAYINKVILMLSRKPVQ